MSPIKFVYIHSTELHQHLVIHLDVVCGSELC